MKKVISFMLIALGILASLSLASCGEAEDDRPYVIGTVFPQYDFARQIGGDDIKCEMLLPPGTDSHGYTGDSPTDIMKISKCDLFIYVGGETDSAWVEKVKEKLKDEEKAPVFLALCDVCETIGEDDGAVIEGDDKDCGEHFRSSADDAEEGYDEHVWTSPKNAAAASRAIADELSKIDPDKADIYKSRCDEYVAKLDTLDGEFRELSERSQNKTLVFADRFPFRYFADEYGYKCFAAFNGCASQSEPAPTTIVRLCNIVEENGLPYVFYIETSNSGVPDLICKNTGCGKLLLHSCHTVTQSELDGGATYLTLMEQNLKNLEKAQNNG